MAIFGSNETTIFFGSLLLGLITWVYSCSTGPVAKLPGPWHTKFTNIVVKYHLIRGRGPQYIQALHEQYGSLVRVNPYGVSTRDITAVQRMYSIKSELLKSPWYQTLVPDPVSVFSTSDVALHRRYRRLLSSSISETGLMKFRGVIESKIRLTIQRMGEETQQRGTTDIFFWATSMTTDIIGELSFGESFRQLETGKVNQYMQDLAAVAAIGGLRTAFPSLVQLSKYVPIPLARDSIEVMRRLTTYAEQSLQRHYRIVEEKGEDAKPTLLSKLYQAGEKVNDDDDENHLAFHEILAHAREYIVAGSDTTANTLTYLLWHVCRDDAVRRQLLDELATLSDEEAYDDAQLKRLPYLNWVVEESLRLKPAVPAGLPRLVPSGGLELGGHYLPGGTTVSAQAHSMHRNPAVFVDPLNFVPSRWEKPTQAMKDSFVPFGGGSRVCIGAHLAKMELRLATARFFLTYPNARISAREGFTEDEMEPVMYFLMSPKNRRCLIDVA